MNLERKDIEVVSDIFKTTGQPTITYVERDSGKLELDLEAAILNRGSLCLVTGPSKTGKTTLYKRVLQKMKLVPLVVRCDKNLGATEFWRRCLEQVNFSRLRELHEQDEIETSFMAKIGAKLGWTWLAEATGELSAEISSTTSEARAKELVLAEPSPMHLIPALRKLPYVLVVEDYHYLLPDVQIALFQQWKAFVDEEVSAIIVGTTHHALDIISSNTELLGRLTHIHIESWRPDDLKRIVFQGFTFLELPYEQRHVDEIAIESVGLPIITQSICEGIFLSKEITKHKKGVDVNVSREELQNVMRSTAAKKFQSFSHYYDKLTVGPRKRARKYDTYELVLACFASSPIAFGLARHEIMERLNRLPIHKTRIPPEGSVNSMLKALRPFQDKQSFELLEWIEDESKLYILEPSFLFYLRWGISEENRQRMRSYQRSQNDPKSYFISSVLNHSTDKGSQGRQIALKALLENILAIKDIP